MPTFMPMAPLTPRDLAYLRSLNERAYQRFISDARARDPAAAADIQRQVEAHEMYTEDKQTVAQFFGVSIETLEHWQTKGMPYIGGGKGGRNAYNLADIARWITKQRSGTPTEGDANADAEAEFRTEKARIAALQRAKMEGELVDRNAYQTQMAEMLGELRKGMDLLVRTWGDDWLDDFERVLSSVEAKLIDRGRE